MEPAILAVTLTKNLCHHHHALILNRRRNQVPRIVSLAAILASLFWNSISLKRFTKTKTKALIQQTRNKEDLVDIPTNMFRILYFISFFFMTHLSKINLSYQHKKKKKSFQVKRNSFSFIYFLKRRLWNYCKPSCSFMFIIENW